MKNIKTLAVLTALGLAACTSAFAQGRPGGGRGQRPGNVQPPAGAPQHPTDAAPAVTHLTEAFAKVAPFDANKDGQLDATEKESLAKSMADGTVQAPAHRTPAAPQTIPPNEAPLLCDYELVHAGGTHGRRNIHDADGHVAAFP